ncbi:Crp/Fnr family transcriptional regulator [Microvirga flavescens]|uniref:Crp/Fnr family transcriptional regulator n=1 Tax=Microvirga flavescens TaxID=2249811 RepID=UPI000DD74F04|nr:Crp/Fnr family transcriptional regulator [Microvirga flavescens]
MRLADREGLSRNEILSALPETDLDRLWSHLELVRIDVGDHLANPSRPVEYIYFIEKGFASIMVGSAKSQMEVALIGREGMVGLPVVLGAAYAHHHCYAQVSGVAQRMTAQNLRFAMEQIPALKRQALLYAHAYNAQLAHAAFVNGRCSVGERLAGWLLMAQDRLDDNEIPLTQEFFAAMLGVRRATVTVALQKLTEQKMIEHRRALVIILNRRKLIATAKEAYAG